MRRSLAQVPRYAAAWEERNAAALAATGPLWLVLGDSTAQGIGASRYDRGYVGLVAAGLAGREPWRVVNLSVAGARLADVAGQQWPRAVRLGLDRAELVTALAGGNDLTHTPLPRLLADLDRLAAVLPAGSVIATFPRGWREAKARAANPAVLAAAERHRLRVADLWALTGPPYRGLFSDGFHPNDAGYRRWEAALLAALASGP